MILIPDVYGFREKLVHLPPLAASVEISVEWATPLSSDLGTLQRVTPSIWPREQKRIVETLYKKRITFKPF